MTRLQEFQQLSSANDFFDFFELEYDPELLASKRLHILKFFGQMVNKIEQTQDTSDEKVLEFYKFALIAVYKNYENGFNPSAADVWNMFENPSACMTCATMNTCTPEDMQNGTTSCSTDEEQPKVVGL